MKRPKKRGFSNGLFVVALLLTGCILPQPQTRLDVSNCDPRERADCIALSREVFEQIVDAYDDAEKLKEAYRFCKEGI